MSIQLMLKELQPSLRRTDLERCVDFGHAFSPTEAVADTQRHRREKQRTPLPVSVGNHAFVDDATEKNRSSYHSAENPFADRIRQLRKSAKFRMCSQQIMKWHSLYIGGLGTCIPQTFESSRDAIRNGRLTSEELEKVQQNSATADSLIETDSTMSAWTRQEALTEFAACSAPTSLRTAPAVIVHAVALHTGLEGWNGSAYIRNNSGFPETPALEIRNVCAGSIVGIDVLATQDGTR
ncbi:MAG: hypothetical protein ACFN3I_05075 [Arachnia propionica]